MTQRAGRQLGAAGKGFTLIELLVVTTIIVISFYAVRPGFIGVIRGAQDRSAIRQLVSLFNAARAEAVARGKLIRVIYDSTEGAFYAEIQPKPAEDRQLFEPLSLMGKQRVRLSQHLQLAAIEVGGLRMAGNETPTIYFYPDGRTDGAAIMLLKSSGDAASLEIAPATGRVKLGA